MKRSIPAALAIVVALAAPSAAQKPLQIERIKDTLYILKGGGATTTVFITSNAVLVVDTKEGATVRRSWMLSGPSQTDR